MSKLRILVTGASGMVGYHTVKGLLADGHELTALLRKSSDDSQLKSLDGDLIIKRCELDDETMLQSVLKGMDVLVHAAGMVNPHASKDEVYKVNVEACKSLLAAADACGVKHFIHISSLSVITGQKDMFNADESTPLAYCGESYADSKIEAEKAVSIYFGRSRMMLTILRPGFIYGPMEKAWMPRLMENLRYGRAMLIDGGLKECNVIYVENLVKAIKLAILNPKADKQVFNLTDGEKVSKKELFDTICDCMGYKRIERRVPSFLAKPVCEIVSAFAPFLPESKRKNLSRFSRAAFRLAGVNQGFSIEKAKTVLAYTDCIPFAVGMRSTLETFRNGRLNPNQANEASIK